MNLCSHRHEEICYESRNCPLCEAQEEIEKLEEAVSDLESEISELNETKPNEPKRIN
jgi:transcription initiation factor IIE alpha subunit